MPRPAGAAVATVDVTTRRAAASARWLRIAPRLDSRRPSGPATDMRNLVRDIVALHDARIAAWSRHDPGQGAHEPAAPPAARDGEQDGEADLLAIVEAGHFANFTIWGLEDQARRRDVADARIATIKRAIDPWNQRRNDLMEAVDAALLARFEGVDVSSAELHSETAGMIVDRLSILALKIASMERIAADSRRDASAESLALAAECEARSKVLREQREDLAGCLVRLLEDFAAGRRRFKTYRQLKAYNDPRLNPALRAAGAARSRADAATGADGARRTRP